MADDRLYVADKLTEEYIYMAKSGLATGLIDTRLVESFFETRICFASLVFFRETDNDDSTYNDVINNYEKYETDDS